MNHQRVLNVLNKFDILYENFYTWLARQYAPEYGGFYYAASSRESAEFQPDIESTAQAIQILERSGLIGLMPEKMKSQIISFFQKRQVPEGYFYDPQNKMNEVERMVARAVMYSSSSLNILGSQPLYPLPGSQGMASLPDYMQSLEIYGKWLEERPWDYAWMAGDNIQASGVFIRQLPEEEKETFLNFILEYLDKRQDPKTGLWGEGRPYIKISGAFKLALFYKRFGKPMPRADRIYQSILATLREDDSEDMCWTRNPMDLFVALRPQLGPYPAEDILEIIEITYDNLKRYLKPDGGFSRQVQSSLEIPNNVRLGKGLVEGDMNAGTQALRIRSLGYEFIGLEDKPLVRYTKDFYKFCNKM